MKATLIALFVLVPAALFAQVTPTGDVNPFVGEWRVELIGQKDAYRWSVRDDGTISSTGKNKTTEISYTLDADKREITLESADETKPILLSYEFSGGTFLLRLVAIEDSPAFTDYEQAFGGAWDKLKGVNGVTDDAVAHLKKQLHILLNGLPIMKGYRK